MENKINIAELLKDCPNGMELDCASYDNVSFDKISDDKKATYPIFCYITDKEGNRSGISFTENGCESKRYGAKCVIFPKGKTTWEGFVPPCKFKDGDVVVAEDSELFQLFLLKYFTHSEDGNDHNGYCYFGWDFQTNKIFEKGKWGFNRLATEKEKQKLFDAIKENGYKWNAETKTLEKLPKFKVGDRIKDKNNKIWFVVQVSEKHFDISSVPNAEGYFVSIDDQDYYELVPNKFDITTLKPYDKVLYRMHDKDTWCNGFYSFYKNNHYFVNSCILTRRCIPYEGNEHLLGTTNKCDDFYETWEN